MTAPLPSTVCAEYAGLIASLARVAHRRYTPLIGYDEAEQLVRIGFWRASLKYDATRGSFEMYAGWVVRKTVGRAVKTVLRGGMRGGPTPPRQSSLSDDVGTAAPRELPAAEVGEFWRRVKGVLTTVQYAAVRSVYADGKTHREAAALSGRTRQAVTKSIALSVSVMHTAGVLHGFR